MQFGQGSAKGLQLPEHGRRGDPLPRPRPAPALGITREAFGDPIASRATVRMRGSMTNRLSKTRQRGRDFHRWLAAGDVRLHLGGLV